MPGKPGSESGLIKGFTNPRPSHSGKPIPQPCLFYSQKRCRLPVGKGWKFRNLFTRFIMMLWGALLSRRFWNAGDQALAVKKLNVWNVSHPHRELPLLRFQWKRHSRSMKSGLKKNLHSSFPGWRLGTRKRYSLSTRKTFCRPRCSKERSKRQLTPPLKGIWENQP